MTKDIVSQNASENNDLTVREYQGFEISQNNLDGYVNLTEMAKAYGKRLDNWQANQKTQRDLAAIERKINEPWKSREQPKAIIRAGRSGLKGQAGGGSTWGHPMVAVAFATWLDSDFFAEVCSWVMKWMSTGENPIEKKEETPKELSYRRGSREEVKDFSRENLDSQIETYFHRHFPKGSQKDLDILSARTYNSINISLMAHTSKEIKQHIAKTFNIDLSDVGYLRDYLPLPMLIAINFLQTCTANYILDENLDPVEAARKAAYKFICITYQPEIPQLERNVYQAIPSLPGKQLRLIK